jgi:hypothetical protein
MRKILAFLAMALVASAARALPNVASVAEREIVPGGTVTVHVTGLSPLPCESLVLFIDGTAMPGLRATCTKSDARFPLTVSDDNTETWRTLVSRPLGFTRPVSVSVGRNAFEQFPTDVLEMPLRLVRGWRFALVIALAILMMAAITIVRLRTNALTNLPRFQIAYFLVVVGVSYGWLWATTGELDTLNLTAFALLGIGAGTALGNAAFGGESHASIMNAAKQIAGAAQNGVAAPVETEVAFGIHSLQTAACTVVFGIVFFAHVYRNGEMPQFGTAELLLLGISGGTYVAFAFAPAQNA